MSGALGTLPFPRLEIAPDDNPLQQYHDQVGQLASFIPGASAPRIAAAQPPSEAEAWSTNAHMASDWLAAQRAESTRLGLLDPATGLPTAKGWQQAGQATASGLLMGSTAPEGAGVAALRAYHGTPHEFAPTPNNPLGEFDLSRIGTGEGAQAFGHGIYLAENEGIARTYRDKLAPDEPTLDFSAAGGPARVDKENAKDFAREFMLDHPDLEGADQRTVTHGADHAVEQFFNGRTADQAVTTLPKLRGMDRSELEQSVRATYDWLSDAKLDPGGAKVGGAPFDASNLTHKAAWYVDRSGGDAAAAVKAIDGEIADMRSNSQAMRNSFGGIKPGHYDEALERLAGIRDLVSDAAAGHADLPVYKAPGHMIEAEVHASPDEFLHWDKPFSEQSPKVQQALVDAGAVHPNLPRAMEITQQMREISELPAAEHAANPELLRNKWDELLAARRALGVPDLALAGNPKGEGLYLSLASKLGAGGRDMGGQVAASQALSDAGIKGIRYLDAASRPNPVAVATWQRQLDWAQQMATKYADRPAELEHWQGEVAHYQKLLGQQGTHNMAVFDPRTINIIRRYGIGALIGGGGAAAVAQGAPSEQ